MLSVIIVNYNSGPRLARCLAHLSRQRFRDFETIVFDNASQDGSIALGREVDPHARYLISAENVGFAAGNNRAAAAANGDWVVFLNPDAYAEPDWLEKLAAGAVAYPHADAFGSAQFNAEDPSRLDGVGDVMHILGIAYRGGFGRPVASLPGDGECFSPCAAAAMYRKSVFDALGGFDETFFCYGEDVDLGFRLRLAGGRAVQLSSAQVMHEGSGITGRHSDFSVYYGHRNRIWLVRKNFPAAFFWVGLPCRMLLDCAILARLAMIGKFGAASRALYNGYFGGGAIRRNSRLLRKNRSLTLGELSSMLAWSPLSLLLREAKLRPACPKSEKQIESES